MNDGEPRLRGCIGTLEARCLINGFKDYALTRYCWRVHTLSRMSDDGHAMFINLSPMFACLLHVIYYLVGTSYLFSIICTISPFCCFSPLFYFFI